MKISRRNFLAAAPLAAGAILQFNGSALGQKMGKGPARMPVALGGDALSRLTWDSFLPYVNTSFTFRDKEGKAVDLQLTRMDDAKPAGFKVTAKGQECFAMTFAGPVRSPLMQDVYSVDHFALGSFSLLITVLGRTRKGVLYEAIINRLY